MLTSFVFENDIFSYKLWTVGSYNLQFFSTHNSFCFFWSYTFVITPKLCFVHYNWHLAKELIWESQITLLFFEFLFVSISRFYLCLISLFRPVCIIYKLSRSLRICKWGIWLGGPEQLLWSNTASTTFSLFCLYMCLSGEVWTWKRSWDTSSASF